MPNCHLNLIRKAAVELLDAIESYHQQLNAVPNEYRRKQLLGVCRYLAERMRDLVQLIGDDETDDAVSP